MDSTEEQAVASGIAQIFQDKFSSREYLVVDPSRLLSWSRLLLMERNLVADDFPEDSHTALILRSDERFAASVNLVDHLRLAVLRGGNQLQDAYQEIDRIDRVVEAVLPYAVSLEWGYLNAEITNIGTGMRASVLLHLPALVATDRAPEIFETIAQSGFMIKGYWISDTETNGRRSLGNMYQVSNMITIGVREKDIVEKLDKVTTQLVHYEQRARRDLMQESKRKETEERIAPALSYRTAVEALSDIRLGAALDLISGVHLETVTSLLFISQRAHIVHAHEGFDDGGDVEEKKEERGSGGQEFEAASIDEERASLIRRYLFSDN
jgi:protein arginine kinase